MKYTKTMTDTALNQYRFQHGSDHIRQLAEAGAADELMEFLFGDILWYGFNRDHLKDLEHAFDVARSKSLNEQVTECLRILTANYYGLLVRQDRMLGNYLRRWDAGQPQWFVQSPDIYRHLEMLDRLRKSILEIARACKSLKGAAEVAGGPPAASTDRDEPAPTPRQEDPQAREDVVDVLPEVTGGEGSDIGRSSPASPAGETSADAGSGAAGDAGETSQADATRRPADEEN